MCDRRPPSALPLLALALLLPACDGAPRHTFGAVRDSAGIWIAEWGGAEVEERIVPTHVADLSPPDQVLPATPWGVATDPASGRTFVADRLSDRVVVFDATGAFEGSFGRSGGGPGEFGNPSALYFGTDGTLRVWDTGRGVLSRWSPNGELLSEEATSVPYWGPGFMVEAERLVTVTNSLIDDGMGMDQQLVIYGGDQRTVLYELRTPMEMMELACMTRPAPTVFAPSLTWAGRGRRTFVDRPPGYRIDVYDDTTLVGSIRRAVPTIAVTREMAEDAVAFGPTPYRPLLRTCNVTAGEVVQAVGHEDEASPVLALTIGADDDLWVTRTEDGTNPSSVDVFQSDGSYRFSVQVSAAVVGFPSPTSFLTLRLDRETDLTVLSLYSLDGRIPQRGSGTGLVGPPSDPGRPEGPDRTATEAWSPPPPDAEMEPLSEFRDCPTCPIMVVIPPGRFVMGTPEGEGRDEVASRWHHLLDDERPRLDVEIGAAMAMGKYEVTFDEWKRCQDAGACDRNPDDEGKGKGDRPVINVGRRHAERYLAWLSSETGHTYRLPSEAEWEYSARAGSTTARYWGDEIGMGNAACTGCGGEWNGRSTAPVGSFAPNAFGLHDMLGNAREWTSDCYTPDNADRPTDGGPVREASQYWENGRCPIWISRGGGWRSEPYQVRAGARRPFNTTASWGENGSSSSGFRVVRELEAPLPQLSGPTAATQPSPRAAPPTSHR